MAWVVTAVTTAIEVGTAASVLTAVAAVGTATTVVGVVTGNKNLMKIGGTLGLVGGVGSLINSGIGALSSSGADAVGALASDGTSIGATGAADAASSAAGDIGSTAADTAASGIDAAGSATSGLNDIAGATGSATAQTNPLDLTGASNTSSIMGSGGATNPWSATQPANTVGNSIDKWTDSLVNPATASPSTSSSATFADSIKANPLDNYAYSINSPTQNSSVLGKLSDAWSKLSPQTQAELVKAGLAIPGAIQQQKNNEAMLALQQQRINQTSYGSQVPKFGIISKAQQG